jgi:D-alanine-D-alanine ligase
VKNADPDWWKTLFDDVYLLTDARSVCDVDLTRREVDVICELIPLTPEHAILDLCGGQGRHSVELSVRGFDGCTVLDYSQYLIDFGKARAAERDLPIAFVQGDARNTGFPAESFDRALILGNSLGYLPNGDDDRQILAETHRVLRPGAWLLVDVANGKALKERFRPNAWHEIDRDLVVCREREMEGDTVTSREVVISKNRGLIRDSTYSIRTYEPTRLASLVEEVGFASIKIHAGFSPHRRDGDYGFMNSRVIATAQKRSEVKDPRP